jgi:hypothetical protein
MGIEPAIKVQIETSYRVSHLQRYGVTECGNVTSVYPPLSLSLLMCVCIYGAPSKARNLTSYIYGQVFYWGFPFLNHA